MSLLVKAGRDAGLNVDWYTYYAGGLGTPPRWRGGRGPRQDHREYHSNVANNKAAKWDSDFRKQAPGATGLLLLRGKLMWDMLAAAINKAKSAEPKAVATRWRHEVRRRHGRGRDAQDRPPADPAAVRLHPGEGRRQGWPKEAKIDLEGSGLAP